MYEGVEVKEVEVEVLPPDQSGRAPGQGNELARFLAWVLDDLIQIPGTKFRVGLDPVIALIPGVGDTSASAMGAILLFQAFSRGVPKVVIARMAANILINAVLGLIPGLGNVLTALFKSNRRNYELIKHYAVGTRHRSTTGDWVFLFSLLGLVLAGLITVAIFSFYILGRFFHWLFS